MSDENEVLSKEEAARLARSLSPVPLDAERVARLKARVLEAARGAAQTQPPATAAVPDLLLVRASEREWRKAHWPGVETCLLHEDATCRSYLLRMQPGTFLPAHKHELDEESIILEGDATIGDDPRSLGPGDYHFAPAGKADPMLRTRNGCIVFVRGQKRVLPTVTPSLFGHLARVVAQRWRAGRQAD